MDSKINTQLTTYKRRKELYNLFFSSNSNTTCSYQDKLKLYTLICCLTQALNKKTPEKYESTLQVLSAIYNRNFENEAESSFRDYIFAISIVCDDLLYGTKDEIPRPNNETGVELVEKIKQLISQWLPF